MLITGGARASRRRSRANWPRATSRSSCSSAVRPCRRKSRGHRWALRPRPRSRPRYLKRQPDAKPAAIEAAYKRLLKDREIRANLDAIRAAGSAVEYRAVDVRDAAAFGALLDELNAAGGIAGVIHGAGVIEDKLLRDKTPESFDRVFGTKVDSALTLARKLDPAKLKFLALFASITSRYGNRGQSDYAAANEVLSKLACDLDRKWPGRVVSIAWGPWAEVGMVADLEKHLVARGLKLIEPAVGAGLRRGRGDLRRKGEPEVLVAGGTEQAARPIASTEPQDAAGRGGEVERWLSPPPHPRSDPPDPACTRAGIRESSSSTRTTRRHLANAPLTFAESLGRDADFAGPRRTLAAELQPGGGAAGGRRFHRSRSRRQASPRRRSPRRPEVPARSATPPASTSSSNRSLRRARSRCFSRRGRAVPGHARRPVRRLPGGRGDLRVVRPTRRRSRPAARSAASCTFRRSHARTAEAELRKLGPSIFGVLVADLAITKVLRDFASRVGDRRAQRRRTGGAPGLRGDGLRGRARPRLAEIMDLMQRQEDEAGGPDVALLAVGGGKAVVDEIAATVAGGAVVVAMDNCPHQCVAVGPTPQIAAVETALLARGTDLRTAPLPPAVPHAALRAVDGAVPRTLRRRARSPRRTRRSTAAPPESSSRPIPDAIRALAVNHWVNPVEFTRMIETMYADGVRHLRGGRAARQPVGVRGRHPPRQAVRRDPGERAAQERPDADQSPGRATGRASRPAGTGASLRRTEAGLRSRRLSTASLGPSAPIMAWRTSRRWNNSSTCSAR